MLDFLVYSIVTLILLVIAYFNYNSKNTIVYRDLKLNLHDDGAVLIKNVFTDKQLEFIKQKCKDDNYKMVQKYIHNNPELLKKIKRELGNDYEFQDYIWIIKKSSVHTCHRDNNGDFFNKGQKHPSYTMILYLEDISSALGFIRTSHKVENRYKHSININDPLTYVSANKGDIIIFNANLIHVGTIHDKVDDHLRIQMKLTHRNDRNKIIYYEKFHKILNIDNTIPKSIRKIQKDLSCMAPILSDLTQTENISSARGSDNGVIIGNGQKVFSYLFYGNDKFYDLPNLY